MKLELLIPALAMAIAPFSGAAFAQATQTPPTAAAQAPSAATKAPIELKSPTEWIVYDNRTYTPVADEVSRHLHAARKAFDTGHSREAATELRAVASELKAQAGRAHAETRRAQTTSKRLDFAAMKVDAAAAALESGRITTKADLDKAIDKAARADMDRRWRVVDVAAWYPVSEEPQRHFGSAMKAYAKHDYKAAAVEIRKANGYMRLEAGRASGQARKALASSVADLDRLAVSVEKGAVKTEKSMDRSFARAHRALALAHRTEATEAWAHRQYEKAGYELKAAAHSLESAAGWARGEAKAGVSAASADTRSLGDKLVSDATWAEDEVVHAFKKLDNAVGALSR